MRKIIIKTSDDKWLEKAVSCYIKYNKFVFYDDVNLGINKKDLYSALMLIKKANKLKASTWKDITIILTGIGLNVIGIWMIRLAILDPVPTDKLWLLLAGGVILTLTGGLSILKALGQNWNVEIKKNGMVVNHKEN